MNQKNTNQETLFQRRYSTPESRWAGIGPYYAMFPTAFADKVISNFTKPGDAVLDPFAGRGTAIFSAAMRHRPATGIEINPLGFVYAKAKIKPGERNAVVRRLEDITDCASRHHEAANVLPKFFPLLLLRKNTGVPAVSPEKPGLATKESRPHPDGTHPHIVAWQNRAIPLQPDAPEYSNGP